MLNWDPSLYLQFDAERTQPAVDLVNRIHIGAPRRIADLGCGPGNSTAILAARWHGAKITGIDNSREMLEQARRQYPAIEWEFADIRQWSPAERFALLFSNAALQWVTGQQVLVPRLGVCPNIDARGRQTGDIRVARFCRTLGLAAERFARSAMRGPRLAFLSENHSPCLLVTPAGPRGA